MSPISRKFFDFKCSNFTFLRHSFSHFCTKEELSPRINNLLKILIYVHLIRLNVMVVELPAVYFHINSLVNIRLSIQLMVPQEQRSEWPVIVETTNDNLEAYYVNENSTHYEAINGQQDIVHHKIQFSLALHLRLSSFNYGLNFARKPFQSLESKVYI